MASLSFEGETHDEIVLKVKRWLQSVEVFDGARGRSLYRGVSARWQGVQGARPQVRLTLCGSVCSPLALSTTPHMPKPRAAQWPIA